MTINLKLRSRLQRSQTGEVTYEFKLKVRDEVDREDDDIVTVHVMNQQPTVPVGPA